MVLRAAVLAALIGSCSLAPFSLAETPPDQAETLPDDATCLRAPQSDCVLTLALTLAAQITTSNRAFAYGRVLAALAQSGQAYRALALGQAAGFLNELQLQGNVAEGLARGDALDAALVLVGAMESQLYRQSVLQTIAAERIASGQLAEARMLAGMLVALDIGTDDYSRRDRVEGLLDVAAEFAAAGYPQDATDLARAAFPLAEDLLRESGSALYPSFLNVKHLWLAGLKDEALHFARWVPKPEWRRQAWVWIGDRQMEAGQAEAALVAYRSALPQQKIDEPGLLGWFGSLFTSEDEPEEEAQEPLIGVARALSALGRVDEAVALLPGFTSPIHRDKALAHVALGLADAGDPARALSLAQQIAGPNGHVDLAALAAAMADHGFSAEAEELFNRAVSLGERKLSGLSAEEQTGLLHAFLIGEIVDIWIARAQHEPLAKAQGSFDAALAVTGREGIVFNRIDPRNAIAHAMAEAGLDEAARSTFAQTEAMIAGFPPKDQVYMLDRLIPSQRAVGFEKEARASFARAVQIAMAMEISLPPLVDGMLTDAVAFQQRAEGEYQVASFLVAASDVLAEEGQPDRARAALSRALDHALTGGHLVESVTTLTDIALRLHALDHGKQKSAP